MIAGRYFSFRLVEFISYCRIVSAINSIHHEEVPGQPSLVLMVKKVSKDEEHKCHQQLKPYVLDIFKRKNRHIRLLASSAAQWGSPLTQNGESLEDLDHMLDQGPI